MRALRLLIAGSVLVIGLGACASSSPTTISITLSLRISQPLTQPVSVEVLDGDGLTIAKADSGAAWDYPPGYRTGDPEPPESAAPTELQVSLHKSGAYTFNVPSVVVGNPCGTCMSGYLGGSFEFSVEDGDHLVLPIGELDWVS